MMRDIARLPLFSLLEKSFISDIKIAAYSDQKLLIVTKSDEVYGLGPLPDSKIYTDELELRPIPALHKKNVERFVFGPNFVFILTANGEVFGWGENGKSQLGFGNKDYVYEPKIIPSLEGKKIIDIACGSTHALALNSDQEVYRWGEMNSGIPAWTLIPNIKARNAIGIACSANASFYLSSNGEVKGIGYLNTKPSVNSLPFFSKGNGFSTSIENQWNRIENLTNIKKIVCGKMHAMALNNDGIVFVWGDNQNKQLSHNIPSNQCTPIRLPFFMAMKITDIAANPLSDVSAAMTENSMIYVWGGCSGGNIAKPYLALVNSFEEVFIYHSHPSMTHKGVTLQVMKQNEFHENGTLESFFDKQEDSDLTITVQEKPIYVHKVILKARSKYFQAMFTNEWKENNKKVLQVDGYSYNCYRSYLSYLYTGDIDITPENVFALIAIADSHSDDALLNLIEKKLNSSSIPEEMVRVLKDVMKLSPENFEKFRDGIRTMAAPSAVKYL